MFRNPTKSETKVPSFSLRAVGTVTIIRETLNESGLMVFKVGVH